MGVPPDPQVVLTPQTQGCTATARTWGPLAVLLFSGLHFHLAQSSLSPEGGSPREEALVVLPGLWGPALLGLLKSHSALLRWTGARFYPSEGLFSLNLYCNTSLHFLSLKISLIACFSVASKQRPLPLPYPRPSLPFTPLARGPLGPALSYSPSSPAPALHVLSFKSFC